VAARLPIMRSGLIWLLISVAIIILDQWTKWLATNHLSYAEPISFVAGFWNWTLLHNTGAAFSLLNNADGWQKPFFLIVAAIVVLSMLVWLRKLSRDNVWLCSTIALIIGGALGNVIDRVRLGYVVDFIQWFWREHYWPAFNVADSAICVGAVGLVLYELLQSKNKKPATDASHMNGAI
jgi:signal peptidase II